MNLQAAKDLIRQHPGQFYTYLLKRPDGTPFYVGKGNCKGFRIQDHVREAFSNRSKNSHKRNTIRKILESGKQVDYEIADFFINEEMAFDRELEMVNFYGRKDIGTGMLCNMSDGGEGNCGNIMSDEAKDKISRTMKNLHPRWMVGKTRTEEAKRKTSISMKGRGAGRHLPEETKQKISKASKGRQAWNKGIPNSEEKNKRISESMKGRVGPMEGKHHTEEAKRKMSDTKRGRPWTEGQRIKMAESRKRNQLTRTGR